MDAEKNQGSNSSPSVTPAASLAPDRRHGAPASKQQIDIESDVFREEVKTHRVTMQDRKLGIAIAFVTGTGFTLYGYDQAVMASLLTANQFEKVFPQVVVDADHGNRATLQSFMLAIYTVGCLIGSIANLWIADVLGRRRTIALGGVNMVIGGILQAASFGFSQILVARIIIGIGNGFNTSTVPVYHAECTSSKRRGAWIALQGALIIFGLVLAYWIDFALFFLKTSSAQWRAPLAIHNVFGIILVVGVFFLPESPAWLLKVNRPAEAMAVISALQGRPMSDPEVQKRFRAMQDAALLEGNASHTPLRELFTGGKTQNFRRVCLAVGVQCLQQLTGVNLIAFYATLLFERLQLTEVTSRIIAASNATQFFFASLVTMALVDRVGRRKLLLFGSIGQMLTMVLLAVLGSIDSPGSHVGSTVLLFAFNTFFALGWLAMGWLYPAEIVGVRIRGPANALSTASNWSFNFLVVMIVGPAFQNIQWRTYVLFAAFNFISIPLVYFFFPETAGRSLEDMDIIFALAHKEGASPVKVSLRKDLPEAGSPEAQQDLGIEKSAEMTPADRVR